MKEYNPRKIEKKWQKKWEAGKVYKNCNRPKKFYALDMFPYPSGEGLHVGHPRGYIATDVVARFKMMQGHSVLHPMGWDAFGLPAENFAIKNKIHPEVAVKKNIKHFKEQMKMFGFTYDWDREINTTDPEYYKWTQWIFLQMFKNGLAYESCEPINWCPDCKTGLALEDLEDGKCERCGAQVEKKPMRQWVLKMRAYADRLLDDLKLLDWPEAIIEQQKNWIGRSEGAIIKFQISSRFQRDKSQIFSEQKIEVFTTRVDTIFGCTYVVIAPENKIISNLKSQISNLNEVEDYIKEAIARPELQRSDVTNPKTGVELKGIKAISPFNNENVPVFVADYVLGHYGTGAVMAVPAHDERDFEFAKKHNLEIKKSVSGGDISKGVFTEDGILVNSGQFTGMKSEQARKEMVKWLEKNKLGNKSVNYKMHDWIFSRQRYWGEPIPLVFCEECKKLTEKFKSQKSNLKPNLNAKEQKFKIQGKEFNLGEILNPGWIALNDKDLPLKFPKVKSYEPTGTGESPLAKIDKWVNVKCPKCGGKAKREANTMPQWAGSSWYYLRYIDSKNKKALVDKTKEKKWMPVNLYVGGIEHATRHLLYARFWHKFLYDIKAVSGKEPFKKLANQGLILAEDGRKMSKRWKNVVNPDDVIRVYGADAVRMYEMFMGPFSQSIAWSTDGIKGTRRFLDRTYKLVSQISSRFQRDKSQNLKQNQDLKLKTQDLEQLLHKTIKKVAEDIESFSFNTAISSLMIFLNEAEKGESGFNKKAAGDFLKLLAPFAPHAAEELWNQLGNKKSIFLAAWPKFDPKKIKEKTVKLVVQINGKIRDSFEISSGIPQKQAEMLTLERENVKRYIRGNEANIQKIVFIPDKIINIVLK